MGTDGKPGPVDDEDTAKIAHPCPDCGSQLVVIGVRTPPPATDMEIWLTIFGRTCVKAPGWRWCASSGHLSVWVKRP